MAIWTTQTATLNALLMNKIEVRAFCTKCRKVFPVDLSALAQRCGPNFSLWDKRWSCRRGKDQCRGKCWFQCQMPGSDRWGTMSTFV